MKNSFSNYPFLPTLQESLKEQNLKTPTEVQNLAFPLLLDNKSLVGVSETGSGKTLAYALPILHQTKTLEIAGDAVADESRPRAVVVVPTRELGEQVSKVFKPFGHTTRLRIRTALGGTPFEMARRNVKGKLEVLVATPGRLVQLMEKNLIDLSDVRTLVFDEADQMLDDGFMPDAKFIAKACPDDCQKVLFSATISKSVEKLMTELFTGAEVIRSKGSSRLVPTLNTVNRTVLDGQRFPVLESILAKESKGGTLIFTNTRKQCDTLAALLNKGGYKCLIYRGEMDKVQRRTNLKTFRNGDVELLVSTDLAGRGLDVEHVGRVINYHLPQEMDNYMHRVGRTARAGRKGLVVNLVTERDEPLMKRLANIKSGPRPD